MPRDPAFADGEPCSPADRFLLLSARLGPRQKEIAEIVYSHAAVTPRAIQARLSEPRSLRVIRTLLDRLIAKGLVKRRQSGRHREFLYLAAIATPRVQQAAAERLVAEQFGGSVREAARASALLLGADRCLDRPAQHLPS